MFTTVRDFITEWKYESQATGRVLEAMTDASLSQRITSDNRTLGQLGWHLATTIHEMLSRTGLEFPSLEGDEHAPASAAVIAESYKRASADLLQAIETQWTDDTLVQLTDMYGEQWPNGLTLRILIKHEVHHRGQIYLMLGMLDVRTPPLYGLTEEQLRERSAPA